MNGLVRDSYKFFGLSKRIDEITPADGGDFLRYLREHLSEATANRHAKRLRQAFTYAVDGRRLAENPQRKLRGLGSHENPSRFHNVTPEEFLRLVEAVPDAEWRLLLALARIGGLRIPGESGALRWGDVDWAENWPTVRSPKTARHRSGVRRVPLYPELRPYLAEVFEQQPAGAEFALGKLRSNSRNYRTSLLRWMRSVGLSWEKPFRNMRASREKEWIRRHPAHVVAEWQGHSVAVQEKHYLYADASDAARDLRTPGLEATQNPWARWGRKPVQTGAKRRGPL